VALLMLLNQGENWREGKWQNQNYSHWNEINETNGEMHWDGVQREWRHTKSSK